VRLPDDFCRRMQELLGEEYGNFLQSFDQPAQYGLRVNTLKIAAADFQAVSPVSLRPVPWCPTGFYHDPVERPGKHPYYHAGLFYLQEPSAMVPAAILDIQPGDRVLDLCAAPGGKSTQAAAALQGRGLLLANDLSASRTKALVKNLDLCGAVNTLVSNEYPARLADRLPLFFNKIIIDAPCSGEGMFRRDPSAVRQWEIHSGEKCVPLQREILHHAARLLSPGGRMVYSTCTFNPGEDEAMIAEFLAGHPDFSLAEIPQLPGFDRGRSEWGGGRADLGYAVRIWPHRTAGEGHFAALLQKEGTPEPTPDSGVPSLPEKKLRPFRDFAAANLKGDLTGRFLQYGDHLYLQPMSAPNLDGIRVIRPGLALGICRGERFEPAHSLAIALKKENFRRLLDLEAGDSRLRAYLKGETVLTAGEAGWTLVAVQGYPLGWAKQVDGILKNHYPKGWRDLE